MDFNALVAECAPWVAPQTMAAIVKTESQFNPLAININGGAQLERQPATKEEAVVTAKWLLANHYNIDLGLGQVNSVNLAKTNLSVEDAFDPCRNLAASATILQWNFESASKRIPEQQAALQAAISAYNTGSFTKGFSNGYVQKVVNNVSLPPAKDEAYRSEIMPIRLVNIAKIVAGKKQKAAVSEASRDSDKGRQVVAGNVAEPHLLSVYGEPGAEASVMVYR